MRGRREVETYKAIERNTERVVARSGHRRKVANGGSAAHRFHGR